MLEFGPGEPWAGNLLHTLHFALTSSPRGGRAQREWQGKPPRSPSRSLTLSLWQKEASLSQRAMEHMGQGWQF